MQVRGGGGGVDHWDKMSGYILDLVFKGEATGLVDRLNMGRESKEGIKNNPKCVGVSN